MTALLEASRLALEALTKLNASPHLEDCEGAFDDEIAALRQAIEQAQQAEPVAWRNAAIRVGEDLCSVGPFGYYDMTAEQWLDWALSVVTVHAAPLPRQPLTDEEIDRIWMHHTIIQASDRQRHAFARAIEAAHGIKREA